MCLLLTLNVSAILATQVRETREYTARACSTQPVEFCANRSYPDLQIPSNAFTNIADHTCGSCQRNLCNNNGAYTIVIGKVSIIFASVVLLVNKIGL